MSPAAAALPSAARDAAVALGPLPTAPATAAHARTECAHCGAALERGVVSGAEYCCAGCEVAAAIVKGAGLEKYYTDREAPAPRPGPLATGWADWPRESCADGTEAIWLRVDGLRCASCAWLVERAVAALPGVAEARVSPISGRARISWHPEQVGLDSIAGRVAALGYRPRAAVDAGAPDRGLLLRLGVAAFSASNVMLMSASVYAGWWDGMAARETALLGWASLAVATPAVLWAAEPLLSGAVNAVRHRVLHIDLPVAVGIVAMYVHGIWATFHGQDTWLDSLTMLIALLLAGRMIEQRGRRRALEAATALAGTAPRVARRLDGDRIVSVAAADLLPGDLVQIGSGEELCADGTVVTGGGQIRMALVTGESEPVQAGPGTAVFAGTLLQDGALTVRVAHPAADSLVARMAAELARATDRPTPASLPDRLAGPFTAATLVLAAVGAVGWTLADGPAEGIAVAMAVLVVACPCALALAAPLTTAAGLGAAARRGLLVRSGEAFRTLADIDTVALDKTGTLTRGEPEVVSADDTVLRIAAGLERGSVHPIARAIVAEAGRRGVALPVCLDPREEPGFGVSGLVDGVRYTLSSAGPGLVGLTGPDGALGTVRLADTLRDDAARTVAALRARGLHVALLSGDHPDVAARMAAHAGIDTVIGAATPGQKAAWIAARRAEGRRVLFVGDGVNDGPALAEADVGIAMGGGAASSLLVADAVVIQEGLAPVIAGLRAAESAAKALRGSAIRSTTYNVLAVLAALVGWINPLIAALAMPLSSAMVLAGAASVERRVRRGEAT